MESSKGTRLTARRLASATPAWFALCLILTAAPASPAAEQALRLDPTACKVAFNLKATMHSVDGTLPLREGRIGFDLETGRASGSVVLDAARATTDSEKRDRKMHEEVLESARFPEISFAPTKVEGVLDGPSGGKVTLTGTLSIHGADHPFSIAADVRREADRLTAKASFTIPYVEWGMKDPSVFVLRVAKDVQVELEAVGTVSSPAAAGDGR